MDDTSIQKFADLIKQSNNIVFFGGAGVSTESGVKDYRGEDGLYTTVSKYGVPPETILSHSFFMSNPKTFYDFYYQYFLFPQVEPNNAHKVLAELERRGKLKAVITQNIDGLHQAAGSKNVFELHGTVYKHHCAKCGREFATDKVRELRGEIPYCDFCGGIIKPDVVLYEESLNEHTIKRSIQSLAAADMLIIGGTSLAVYPAAGFLQYFDGDKIVLINRDATSFDDRATLVFRDKIGKVLSKTLECLDL